MTVQEILTDVYEQIGEPSDLLPYVTPGSPSTFDISLAGAQRLLAWLNRSQRVVSNWKFRDGRLLRIRNLFSNHFFKTYVYSGTASDGADASITLPAGSSAIDDAYNGWIVEITGGTGESQSRMVTDYDGTTLIATVHADWDTNPDATSTFSLYKNFMKYLPSSNSEATKHIALSPVSEICTVLKVRDLEEEYELVPKERTYFFTSGLTIPGTPTAYWEYGNSLYFDVPVDEVRGYELLYARYPSSLTLATDEPEIPAPLHEAILMWCVWQGHKRNQDTTMAYAVKRDLIDFMETMREQREFSAEFENGALILEA